MRTLVIAIILVAASGCIKKTTSTTGQLFECKVNGEAWRPKGHASNFLASAMALNYPPVLKLDYAINSVTGNHQLKIEASRYRDADSVYVSNFQIFIPDIQTGAIAFSNITGSAVGVPTASFRTESNCRSSNLYDAVTATGIVNISHFSATERRIAGTFNFRFDNCSSMITDGRFDLRF